MHRSKCPFVQILCPGESIFPRTAHPFFPKLQASFILSTELDRRRNCNLDLIAMGKTKELAEYRTLYLEQESKFATALEEST